MEPVTQFVLGTGLVWVLDKMRERASEEQKARVAGVLPPPMRFTPEQLEMFTVVSGGVRAFMPDTNEVTLALLSARSLQPVPEPGLTRPGQQAWQVVPLASGWPTAIDIISQALQRGATVLGSLSLVMLPSGSTAPMVILIGDADTAMLAAEGGAFALLRNPAEVQTGVMPETAPAEAVAPVAPVEPPMPVPTPVVTPPDAFHQTVEALADKLTQPKDKDEAPAKRSKRNGLANGKDHPVVVDMPIDPPEPPQEA